jgi:YfiH family protein
VDENRRRFFNAIGDSNPRLYTQHQIHSDRITVLGGNELSHYGTKPGKEPEGDALVSRETKVWLGIKTADCLPILLGDPTTGAKAAVHAGWKGTLARVVEKTVKLLKRHFQVDPRNLLAALGPAACGECYHVGTDVAGVFQKEFKDTSTYIAKISQEKFRLDVPMANIRQLLDAGLHPANIHSAAYCTMHQNQHFFSHRKEGKTDSSTVGRMLAVIGA